MNHFPDYTPHGVIPAALMVFTDDYEIDEKWTRKHLADLADVDGVTGIVVNGHASEVHACSFEEQKRMLEFAVDEVGGRVPLINGVYADSSLDAGRIAAMSEAAGASALLVFPPNSMIMGGQMRPEMAIAHYEAITQATDLPLILFQYTLGSGLGYPFETLMKLVERFPTIRAIKDWCNDGYQHERHIRTLQNLERPVNVLTTHSAWLLGSLCMGATGLLSGAGSVVADLQAQLLQAVKEGDLKKAQAINDRYYPMAKVFYTDPFLDMHNRMKECLALLGRIPKAVVRPPLMKLPENEIETLRKALIEAGLLLG